MVQTFEVFIAFEKADKTMVLRNARASAIIALLEEDKNVTSGIRILNLKDKYLPYDIP